MPDEIADLRERLAKAEAKIERLKEMVKFLSDCYREAMAKYMRLKEERHGR